MVLFNFLFGFRNSNTKKIGQSYLKIRKKKCKKLEKFDGSSKIKLSNGDKKLVERIDMM
jgi:hypothetical protein